MLFDFDGVLVESAAIKTAAFQALYAEHGAEVVAAAVAHHQAHGGISRRHKIRHIHRHHLGVELSEDDLDELCHRFSRLVEDAVVAAPLVPGAREFVHAWAASQRPSFVVSGTPDDELTRILERRGMLGWFSATFGSPPEKPPIIRQLLHDHGLDPARLVFIGDALTDYDAARTTGLAFIGRVRPGDPNPFPAGTPVIADLTRLAL